MAPQPRTITDTDTVTPTKRRRRRRRMTPRTGAATGMITQSVNTVSASHFDYLAGKIDGLCDAFASSHGITPQQVVTGLKRKSLQNW